MCSKEVQLSQLNKLIITYKEIYNPTTDEDIEYYDAFVDFIEYAENLKHLPEELLTDDDKQSLQTYNNLPFELEHELINSLKDKIKYIPRNNQKIDKFNRYINTVSNVKERSKVGIPQVNNITATKTLTTKDEHTINYKGQVETYKEGEFSDLYILHIKLLLTTSCYELIPYSSYNLYGCQFAKTCFNTIGKDYEYISPFIDYDLTELEENTTFKKAINECKMLINDFMYYVLNDVDFKNLKRLSVVGYSNIQDHKETIEIKENEEAEEGYKIGYIHIQHKPNSGKNLSLHIVFADVKIHVLEFIARIKNNLSVLKKHKAFDIMPYLTGSLRHMASPKNGLSEHAEDKQVTDLTDEEILDQFITYYNTKTVKTKIEVDFNNIHNKQTFNPIKFDPTLKEYKVKLIYGGHEIDNIESIIKALSTDNVIESDYSGRFKWLWKYVMYKKSLNQQITDTEINNLLPGVHDHLKEQIEDITNNKKLFTPHPKVLLNYIKQFIPSEFDYEITDLSANNYVVKRHFGEHKVEDMKKCKTFKELIEVITGSFALSSEDKLMFICEDGFREYNTRGQPNKYVAKFYPSCLKCTITEDDLWEDDEGNITQNIASHRENVYSDDEEVEQENELLNKLLKNRLAELGSNKRKKEIILSADAFIKILCPCVDKYIPNAFTRFKLNGYSEKKVNKQAYEDVKKIIQLFENKLVEPLRTERPDDNPIQELLRCIKYLLVNEEKVEKGFMVVDSFGATGKTLLFGKILVDFFGIAGINNNSTTKIDSKFSDEYNYLFSVYNEVEKGKNTLEACSSYFKQATDSIMNSHYVKCVQEPILAKNTSIPVFLSNSYDLNGAFDISDPALVGRYVFIEFEPFENNGNVDTLKGLDYYTLVDNYKARRDLHHIFSYDFRNALYKYIMELDISKYTDGRAQPSKYKEEKFMDIAKDRIAQITDTERKPYIMENNLYNLDLASKTLTPYTSDIHEKELVGFQISKLVNVPQAKRELFLKTLGYKSALRKKIKFHLNDKIWNTELIICEKEKLVELLEVRENIEFNM